MNMNKWQVVTLLVLLDLPRVGFDTVNQRILHDRLRASFEISGLALSWSSYYLNNRSQLLYFSKWRKHCWPAGRCASMVGPCRSAFVIYASKPFSVLEHQRQTYMLTRITRLTWRVQSTETDIEKPIDNYRYQEPIHTNQILLRIG